jgi:uncharacterized phage-associated protein
MIANSIVRAHPSRFDLLQVCKLVQIVQGWGLEGGKKVVDESPVAWEFGPMHASLYQALRYNGLTSAKQKIAGPITPPLGTIAPLVPFEDSWTHALISQVVELYGNFTGTQLSAMLNRVGSPWHEVYGAFPKLRASLHGMPINDAVIVKHYRRLRATSGVKQPIAA